MNKNNKQQKNKAKQQASAFRFQVSFKSKTAYPTMSEEIKQRLTLEVEWFVKNNFAKGLMDIKEITDAAQNLFRCRIGRDHGFLAGSAVAYSLGLVGQDPIAEGKCSAEFNSEVVPVCLNVSLHFDPQKRNMIVNWASDHFQSPAMTRMGVFIIKIGNVIVEFHRNLNNI